LNRLPEIKRFIKNDAPNYPDLQVEYYGGDPRIKFIVSEDGTPLEINPYTHYTDSKAGKGLDDFVNISNMKTQEVIDLLKARGIKTKDEVAAQSTGSDEAAHKDL
jgi:Sep15/SelM redox domain